jgi:hypothetical protein
VIDLRDLRSVVSAADSIARDDESRTLARELREGLTARVEAEHTAWLEELTATVGVGRIVRALRLSSRPPKAGAPLPAELATKLADAASASLTADTAADRWATVLDALSFSPVRLTVVPASKPETPSEELVAVITRMADRVPKVAEAFGIDPSAAPSRKGRGRGGAGGAKGGGAPKGGGKPRPPRPPKPPKPTADVAMEAAPTAEAPPAAEAEADAPAAEPEAPAVEAEVLAPEIIAAAEGEAAIDDPEPVNPSKVDDPDA